MCRGLQAVSSTVRSHSREGQRHIDIQGPRRVGGSLKKLTEVLLHDLKFGGKEGVGNNIFNQALRSGDMSTVERIGKTPILQPGLMLYYLAFNELTTCRQIGMAEGPIPWTAMSDYAQRKDMDNEEFMLLTYLIQSMDVAYLRYREENRPKN